MNSILLIRLRLIGDVVFTTPAVRAVKRRFPDARITYLVEPMAAAVVAGNPHIDEVLVAPSARGLRGVLDFARLAFQLRARRFDLVLDFHGGPRSSWLTWATGAPVRIGYTVKGRSWHYTVRVPRSRVLRARHSVLNQWDLLAPLEIDLPTPGNDPTTMVVDSGSRRRVDRRLEAAGVGSGVPLVVIHVSAGNPFRRWPATSFVDLIVALAEHDPHRRFLLTSGPSDESARQIVMHAARERLAPSRSAAVVDVGELDLNDLHAALARASLFVGPDSGPLHIAGTTNVPIVGLYGPTLSARSAPWRNPALPVESVEIPDLPCRPCDQRTCEPGDFRCLTRLSPELVVAAAERALSAGSRLLHPVLRLAHD